MSLISALLVSLDSTFKSIVEKCLMLDNGGE